jgi:hypothetical protein
MTDASASTRLHDAVMRTFEPATARFVRVTTRYGTRRFPPRSVAVGAYDFTALRMWEWDLPEGRGGRADWPPGPVDAPPAPWLKTEFYEEPFWYSSVGYSGDRWQRQRTESPPENQPPGEISGRIECLWGADELIDEPEGEDLAGIATTRYRTTVDVERALERAPEFARWRLHHRLRAYVPRRIETTVWLDADGRVRRLVLEQLRFTRKGPIRFRHTFDETLDLYDFGTEITIEPPPRQGPRVGALRWALPRWRRRDDEET